MIIESLNLQFECGMSKEILGSLNSQGMADHSDPQLQAQPLPPSRGPLSATHENSVHCQFHQTNFLLLFFFPQTFLQ